MAAFSSSPSSSTAPWKYDVFLSFRGLDTRTSFIDHLYFALRQRGIEVVFKDDLELEGGRPTSDTFTAIEESRFFLIVFSKDYASSSWCLKELDKIFECCCKEGAGRQTAFPIFHGVDPSEVRKQTGRYGEAFLEHERVLEGKIDQVHRWRKAMTGLANLSGWDRQNRGEVDFIREVVEHIHRKLRKSNLFSSIDAGDYIGMDSHLEKLSPYLNTVEEANDVRLVGICGMAGVGKSTLAKFVYSKMSCQFDGSSFLENIRVVQAKDGGLAGLQRQLLIQVLGINEKHIWSVFGGINEIKRRLSLTRILVILDDVDHLNQLETLAGSSHWFGSGSRIIITTRDEHLLKCHGVKNIYRMGELGEDEALKLFCWRAFRDYTPAEGYEVLSKEFINYASRLPLALAVLGSYVHGRSVSEWKSALDKLKKFPNKEILENLRLSFDGLDEIEKKIFLDIACFFVGDDINFVIRILEGCEFYPGIGVSDLIDKSLITISESKVWMHALVQQLGQEIVREEHEEPGCRSRIWLYEDAWHILSNDTGSEQIEGIVLNINPQEIHRAMSSNSFLKMKNRAMNSESFLKMKKLRLLRLPNLHYLQGQEYLSNELRYLEGNGYPFESLPSCFHPDKLVDLRLSHSNIEQLWKRKKFSQPPLRMLKVINLSHSQNLIRTPDFSEFPNLEELVFEGCTRLNEVHQSIGVLERLVLLNLKDCRSLKELPSTICDLKSLKNLILHGCPELLKLPERLGDLTCLEVLDVGRGVGNEQPPTRPWDFLLRPWQLLPWKDPSPVALTLPSLSTLCCLRELNLSYCKLREGAIPNDLGCFPLLQWLDLSGNDFKSVPTSIIQLSSVLETRFNDCKMLQSLPDLPTTISHIGLSACASLETLPDNISELSGLSWLDLDNCERLRTLPDLSSIINHLTTGRGTQYLSLSFLNCLKKTEKQDVFGWLKEFLHSILRNKGQGRLSLPEFIVLTSHAGGGIPRWFNYVSEGASLKVELPPYWFNDELLGFSIFAVFGVEDYPAIYSYDLAVTAWNTTGNPTCVSFYHESWYFQLNTCFHPDVALSHVIPRVAYVNPRDRSNSKDWWNSFSHLEVSVADDGIRMSKYYTGLRATLKAKYVGLRLVYEQDFEELSRWIGTSSSPPFHNVVSTNK